MYEILFIFKFISNKFKLYYGKIIINSIDKNVNKYNIKYLILSCINCYRYNCGFSNIQIHDLEVALIEKNNKICHEYNVIEVSKKIESTDPLLSKIDIDIKNYNLYIITGYTNYLKNKFYVNGKEVEFNFDYYSDNHIIIDNKTF